jgi:hypothetical protein
LKAQLKCSVPPQAFVNPTTAKRRICEVAQRFIDLQSFSLTQKLNSSGRSALVIVVRSPKKLEGQHVHRLATGPSTSFVVRLSKTPVIASVIKMPPHKTIQKVIILKSDE